MWVHVDHPIKEKNLESLRPAFCPVYYARIDLTYYVCTIETEEKFSAQEGKQERKKTHHLLLKR